MADTMTTVERLTKERRGLNGISTGFRNLDAKCHGLRPGELIILAARPSMGKTSLAMNIAENVATGFGDPQKTIRPVAVFSLEMSKESLSLRMLCSRAQVSSFKLSAGFPSQEERARLAQNSADLASSPIWIDDNGGMDVRDLRARARRMKVRHHVAMVIVDYLQLLHARGHHYDGRQQETAYISGQLKAMAKELFVPVLALSQLSRAPDQRDKTGRPKLSDLRDSGAIEQDADVVWLLRRPCKYEEGEGNEDDLLAVVDVAKNRNGPTGEARMNFAEEYTRFGDRLEAEARVAGSDNNEGEW